MSTYLDPMQVDSLLRGINPNRVSKRDGMSYVQAYDIRRMLVSTFGFGRFSADVVEATLVYEDVFQGEKPAKGGGTYTAHTVSVGYMVRLKLTVCAPDGTVLATYTEAAAGDATNFPINKRGDAHDFAVKTAESQALKRCAINLGDAGGLGLYNDGKLEPLVRFVLGPDPARINPDGKVERPKKAEDTQTTDEHIATPLAVEAPPTPPAAPPLTPVKQRAEPRDAALPLPGPEHDIRDRALAVADSNSNAQVKKAALMKLLLEASTAQLKDAQVTGPNGHGMSLEALIHAEIANARARAS